MITLDLKKKEKLESDIENYLSSMSFSYLSRINQNDLCNMIYSKLCSLVNKVYCEIDPAKTLLIDVRKELESNMIQISGYVKLDEGIIHIEAYYDKGGLLYNGKKKEFGSMAKGKAH